MSHLIKVILVAVILLITSLGMDNGWGGVVVVLYMYYFIFIANLFKRQYTSENALTKIFFEFNETPLIIAGAMIATVILIIKKRHPMADFDGAYLNAVIGGTATTFARFKRGKLGVR